MGVRTSKLSKLSKVFGVHGFKRLEGPPLTPKGYVPVCVGVNEETKRFMVHRTSLRDSEFLDLLYRSAEEYGFCNKGVLRINYDAKEFEDLMISQASPKILKVQPIC